MSFLCRISREKLFYTLAIFKIKAVRFPIADLFQKQYLEYTLSEPFLQFLDMKMRKGSLRKITDKRTQLTLSEVGAFQAKSEQI